jgi:hypothetical protein
VGIGTLNVSNSSYITRCSIASSVYLTRRTLTLSNPIASTFLDFFSINMNYIGAGSAFANSTSIGDGGDNLNITATAPRTVYYNAGNASWISASWSTLQGSVLSTPSTEYIPLPQDTVILPSSSLATNFAANSNISINIDTYCTNIISTNRTEAVTINLGSSNLFPLSNLELNSSTTISNGTVRFIGANKRFLNNINSSQNLNLPSVIFNQDIDCQAPILNCSGNVTYNTGSGYFKNINAVDFTKNNTYLELSGSLTATNLVNINAGNTNCPVISATNGLFFSGSSSCTSNSVSTNNILQFASTGTFTFNDIVGVNIYISNGIINVNSSLTCAYFNANTTDGQLNFNNAIMYVDQCDITDASFPINFFNSSIVLGSQGSASIPYIDAVGAIFNPSIPVDSLNLANTVTINTFRISGTIRYSNIKKLDLTKSSTVYFNSDVYADNLDIGNGSLLTQAPGSTLRRITPGGESIVKNLAINGVSARGSAGELTSWRAPSNLGNTVTSANGWVTSVYIIASYLGNFLSFF